MGEWLRHTRWLSLSKPPALWGVSLRQAQGPRFDEPLWERWLSLPNHSIRFDHASTSGRMTDRLMAVCRIGTRSYAGSARGRMQDRHTVVCRIGTRSCYESVNGCWPSRSTVVGRVSQRSLAKSVNGRWPSQSTVVGRVSQRSLAKSAHVRVTVGTRWLSLSKPPAL
jgi:hypothetical protein